MTGFAAALALLGLVVLILAGLCAAARLLAVARSAPPAMPFSGGLPVVVEYSAAGLDLGVLVST